MDTSKIKDAGANILNIAYAVLFGIIIAIIGWLIIYYGKQDLNTIKEIYYLIAALDLLCLTIIIFNLIGAGNNLMSFEIKDELLITEDNTISDSIEANKKGFIKAQIIAQEIFIPTDYPRLIEELDEIKLRFNSNENSKCISEILISFCEKHSINKLLFDENPVFSKQLSNNNIDVSFIESLFRGNKENPNFINELKNFIKNKLA
jgi:hypothetical protein